MEKRPIFKHCTPWEILHLRRRKGPADSLLSHASLRDLRRNGRAATLFKFFSTFPLPTGLHWTPGPSSPSTHPHQSSAMWLCSSSSWRQTASLTLGLAMSLALANRKLASNSGRGLESTCMALPSPEGRVPVSLLVPEKWDVGSGPTAAGSQAQPRSISINGLGQEERRRWLYIYEYEIWGLSYLPSSSQFLVWEVLLC